MEEGSVRARVSLELSPHNKSVPMISLTTYVLPSITAYTGFANSALRGVASSERSQAGGSGFIKPASDPLADRVEPILINTRARISAPGPDRRTRSPKNRF